jgi:hypothetical protein
MKKSTFAVSIISFLLLVEMALCLASQHILAQSHNGSSGNSTNQQQPMQSPAQNLAQNQSNNRNQSDNIEIENGASAKTFSGKIVKSGNKKSGNKLALVASDPLTTYQLDDQQSVHDFLNKTVTVTRALDTSTGTIRVTAIDPSP